MVVRAIRIAFDYALSMFCRPGSISAVWRLLFGLYTPEVVVLPTPCSLGDTNDLSIVSCI